MECVMCSAVIEDVQCRRLLHRVPQAFVVKRALGFCALSTIVLQCIDNNYGLSPINSLFLDCQLLSQPIYLKFTTIFAY